VKELAELLEIDTEFIARDLAFYRGVGGAYLSQIEHDAEQHLSERIAYAATALRRAGSHALLLDETDLATEMFGNSAKCYEVLRRPYASMMWTLARNLKSAASSSERSVGDFIRSEGRYPSDQSGQLAFALLVQGVREAATSVSDNSSSRQGFRTVSSELSAFSTTPLGILGIPIESYVSLAVSMEGNASPEETEYHLSPFLNAFEVAITTARSKAYHWRRLLMPFHPVEPDILSVFTVANAWFKHRDRSLVDWIRKRQDSRFASKLLSAALEEIGG
jgi:hypothetical protein